MRMIPFRPQEHYKKKMKRSSKCIKIGMDYNWTQNKRIGTSGSKMERYVKGSLFEFQYCLRRNDFAYSWY